METGLVKQSTFTTPRLTDSPGLDTHSDRGARRAEYLLVIYPSGELQEKLLDEQQQFSADYGLQMTVRNKPHITVAAFQAGEIMEDTLIRWVQRICNSYKSFELTLNNYSGFPPHTIYLRVQDPHPFRQLMQQLRSIDEFIRSSGCPPANLITRPFLSIAGGLTEQLYNKAMPDYSRKTFHDSFQVDELVLLKRTHSFDACKTVNIFRLQPETSNLQPGITGPSAVLPPHHL
jgi:2'-5' RNA ligase